LKTSLEIFWKDSLKTYLFYQIFIFFRIRIRNSEKNRGIDETNHLTGFKKKNDPIN